MKTILYRFAAFAAFAVAFILPGKSFAQVQQPHAYQLSGDFRGTHDPSIMRQGNTWYVFATGKARKGGQFQIRCSTDLHRWQFCGQVFDAIPAWIRKASSGTQELWVPDISYEQGEYRLYYAYSLFGKNTSGIALVTNKTLDRNSPDYKWVDRGLVLRSTMADNFNAIDPNYVTDRQGRAWLAFGSFWSGIKMRRLNPRTGKLSKVDTRIYLLANRRRPENALAAPPGLPPNWQAVEAPFLVYHGGYYYLFVSWDLCCRGTKSTYRTIVGRSKHVTGPYVDAKGVPMMQGGGTELLTADQRWLGPGGESIYMQKNRPDLIVFHAYDARTGRPALQVSTLTWQNGWPHAALEN